MKVFYPSQSVSLSQSTLSVLSHASFRGSSHPSRHRGHLSPNQTEKKGNWRWLLPERTLLTDRYNNFAECLIQDARQVSKSQQLGINIVFIFPTRSHSSGVWARLWSRKDTSDPEANNSSSTKHVAHRSLLTPASGLPLLWCLGVSTSGDWESYSRPEKAILFLGSILMLRDDSERRSFLKVCHPWYLSY